MGLMRICNKCGEQFEDEQICPECGSTDFELDMTPSAKVKP